MAMTMTMTTMQTTTMMKAMAAETEKVGKRKPFAALPSYIGAIVKRISEKKELKIGAEESF